MRIWPFKVYVEFLHIINSQCNRCHLQWLHIVPSWIHNFGQRFNHLLARTQKYIRGWKCEVLVEHHSTHSVWASVSHTRIPPKWQANLANVILHYPGLPTSRHMGYITLLLAGGRRGVLEGSIAFCCYILFCALSAYITIV